MSRFPRHVAAVALLPALGALGACGPVRRGGPAPAVEPVYIVFTNQASDQATVYARRTGGDTQRLGEVSPGRTETLRLPTMITRDGSVTIVARLLARRAAPTSGEIQVRPGERVAVTLPPAANLLTVLPASDP